MALVAPFVLLLIFGSLEFARMMMVRQAFTNAAREGCRYATLATTENVDEAEEFLRGKLRSIMTDHDDDSILRVSIEPDFSAGLASGTEITSTVEVDCANVSWLPPIFFSGIQIRTSASMARE